MKCGGRGQNTHSHTKKRRWYDRRWQDRRIGSAKRDREKYGSKQTAKPKKDVKEI